MFLGVSFLDISLSRWYNRKNLEKEGMGGMRFKRDRQLSDSPIASFTEVSIFTMSEFDKEGR